MGLDDLYCDLVFSHAVGCAPKQDLKNPLLKKRKGIQIVDKGLK
ncbi:hypothetical protein PAE4_10732 [Bacillus altitudinis]|nr:hypothetical protein PAE4_10732 [Bacillus altitudinis]